MKAQDLIRFVRENFANDGAEGETVHALATAHEAALAKLAESQANLETVLENNRGLYAEKEAAELRASAAEVVVEAARRCENYLSTEALHALRAYYDAHKTSAGEGEGFAPRDPAQATVQAAAKSATTGESLDCVQGAEAGHAHPVPAGGSLCFKCGAPMGAKT